MYPAGTKPIAPLQLVLEGGLSSYKYLVWGQSACDDSLQTSIVYDYF